MKKWLIAAPIVLILVFILGRASNSTTLTESQTISQVSNNASSSSGSSLECQSIKPDIDKLMAETYWTSYKLDEIFYSPIKKSCLYAVTALQTDRAAPYTAFIIWDYYSSEMIFYRDTSLAGTAALSGMYQNARAYLKNEDTLQYPMEKWNLTQ